jgi:hypothetical protein
VWTLALFLLAVGVIAAGSTLFWRWWAGRMPSPPRWQEAFLLVWVDIYGMPWDDRPRVIWVSGQSFTHNGKPVTGITDRGAITVAFLPGFKVSDTAFAHELRHAARHALGIDGDGEHVVDDWQPGGIVAQAQEALRARGL